MFSSPRYDLDIAWRRHRRRRRQEKRGVSDVTPSRKGASRQSLANFRECCFARGMKARIVNVSSHQQGRNVKWRRSSISSFFPTRVPNRDTSFVRGVPSLPGPWRYLLHGMLRARPAGRQCVYLIHAEEESNVVVHETVHRDPTMNTSTSFTCLF